ncbi:hypothetical protein V8E54_010867 [Elaphomyces granulatus]
MASTRSKLVLPSQPMSLHRLFLHAKEELQKCNSLHLEALSGLSGDTAATLISNLEADKSIGEGRFRFNFDIATNTLSAFIPTYIHDSVQIAFQDLLKDMLKTGFLTWSQFEILSIYSGSRYQDFVGIHAGSTKEPDAGVLVDNRVLNGQPSKCPIWLNECAYSDPKTKLNRDIRKWIDGPAGGVAWAVATNFNKRRNSHVSGSVELYTNNGTTVISKLIFPQPQNPIDDRVQYTRNELFNNSVPLELGQTPQDPYTVDIGIFRRRAAWAAEQMALVPV